METIATATPRATIAHEGPPADRSDDRGVVRRLFGNLRHITIDELWKYRELVYQFTLRNIRIRYKQAAMGFLWALFMPALVVAAGALVRFAMAYLGGEALAAGQIAGMAIKALPWSFFVGAIGFGVASLTGNLSLITKVFFPREALPLASTLAQAFDSLIGGTVLFLLLPVLGVHYGWTLLWVPPLALLLFAFTLAVSLLFGCGNLFFRDVKYIVQVLLTFGIFFTPVFFEPAMFGALGAQLMMLNPLAPLLEGFRLAVVEGHNLVVPLTIAGNAGGDVVVWSPWYLAYSAVWAVVGLAAAALLFHRLELVFAEYA
jgi:lipopolysaccharide transport system permease protein